VLRNNREGLTKLAELLLEKEVIFSEDLEKIFGRSKADMAREEREKAAGNKIQTAGENAGELQSPQPATPDPETPDPATPDQPEEENTTSQ